PRRAHSVLRHRGDRQRGAARGAAARRPDHDTVHCAVFAAGNGADRQNPAPIRMSGYEPLITGYRGLICDLDGVVYRGADAVPRAVETLNRVTADGVPVVFATNNASRPP